MQERVDDAIKAWAGILRLDMQPSAATDTATDTVPRSSAGKASRKQRAQARHAAEKELPLAVRKSSMLPALTNLQNCEHSFLAMCLQVRSPPPSSGTGNVGPGRGGALGPHFRCPNWKCEKLQDLASSNTPGAVLLALHRVRAS